MPGNVNKLFVFKSLLTTPSNVLSLHLKETFPPIIWNFTEGVGDGIESRLPFQIFSTLNRNIDFGSVWTVASRYIALLQRRWTKKKNGGGALALLYVLVGTTIYKTLKLNRFVASSKHLHLLSGCLCFVEIIRCYLGGTH